jgi:DNA repair protein RadA/Sms
MGRCTSCGEWNTIAEQIDTPVALLAAGKPLQASDVSNAAKTERLERLPTGMVDLDTTLGGGIVAGSVILLAGQPGIGKSTLVLQLADKVAATHAVLYISGEESAHQVGMRAGRLKATSSKLKLATSTSANDIAATIAGGDYQLAIVDSIQALATEGVTSAAGSVAQITNSTQLIWQRLSSQIPQLFWWDMSRKKAQLPAPKCSSMSLMLFCSWKVTGTAASRCYEVLRTGLGQPTRQQFLK